MTMSEQLLGRTIMVKYYVKWAKFLAVLVPGAAMASCMTDMRDATVTGAMDAVAGTVSSTATAAFPLADFIGRVWAQIFTNMGL
jgi:hypothetical protein